MAKKKSTVELSNKLTQLFRNTIEKENLGVENNYVPSYSTGIDLLDYYNGRVEGNEIVAGINGGKIITIIGRSGSGKTTLAIKMAASIVEDYDNGQVLHYDFENATTMARIKSITGWDKDKIANSYIKLNSKIYSETFYTAIKALATIKLENYDDLKIDTGDVDMDGNNIYVLPPTVVICDSFAAMIPKDISEEEDLSGSMAASAMAKTNNAIVKRIVQPIQEANITIIFVNHITQKISIGPVQTTNALNYLGQDESVPGGTSCLYMSDTLIKVQASSKLEPEKDFGIKGFMVIANYLKSRSNSAGRKFTLVYDQTYGFDNFLTNFNQTKEMKLLRGNGRAYYYDFDPNTKFTQKNVKTLYETNEEWAQQFDEMIADLYYEFVNTSAMDEDDSNEVEEYDED